MQLHSIRLKGIGPFTKEIVVQFDGLGKLVAIIGENGAGKTVLLEAGFPGPIFRKTPTRDTLIKLATSRQSYAENSVSVNGSRYTLRHILDSVSRKSEALVVNEAGQPLLPSGKLPEFDRWVQDNFPPPEVFFSSIFAAQAFTGFLGLSKSDRKAVLNRVLGIEIYESLSQEARDRASAARSRLGEVEARISELGERAKLDEAKEAVGKQAEINITLRETVAAAKSRLETLRAEVKTAEAECTRIDGQLRERATLAELIEKETAALAEVEERLTNWAKLLEQSDEIKAAAKRSPELRNLETEIARWRSIHEKRGTEWADLNETQTKIDETNAILGDAKKIRAAKKRLVELEKDKEATRKTITSLEEKENRLSTEAMRLTGAAQIADNSRQSLVEQIEKIEPTLARLLKNLAEAEADLPGAKDNLAKAQKEYDQLAAEADRLNALTLSTSQDQVQLLHAGHKEITGLNPTRTLDDAISISSGVLSQYDESEKLAKELPGQRDNAGGLRAESEIRLGIRRQTVKDIEETLKLRPQIQEAQQTLATLQEKLVEVEKEIEQLGKSIEAQGVKQEAAKQETTRARGVLDTVTTEYAQVKEIADKGETLASAETLLTQLNALKERHQNAILNYEIDLADIEKTLGLNRKQETIDPDGFDRLTVEKTSVDALAEYAERLTQSEARTAELKNTKEAHARKIADLTKQREAIPEETKPMIPPTIIEERELETAEQTLRDGEAAQLLLRAKVEEAEQVSDRVRVLQREREHFTEAVADETLMAHSYGRDGLQALEIDAAGPELSGTINKLLRTCFGSRFTVTIETTRMSADQKRQLEGCEVVVIDNEKGRIASGESLSGGQKVIVGEAISLALTKLACDRNGITNPTLVRDESGAALSPMYAPKYIGMLRLAMDMIGSPQCLFVSHDPDVQELADSAIHINNDGTVTVN
jgi:DNA repair protein SbcC/Rad50